MVHQEDERNRRNYERFAVGFKIRIYDIRESGLQLLEDSVLNNVSGGGVCFLSCSPTLYHPGQRLLISIRLPGTDALDARLEGNATVAWVGGKSAETQGTFVGVSMDDLLDFSRRAIPEADKEGKSS